MNRTIVVIGACVSLFAGMVAVASGASAGTFGGENGRLAFASAGEDGVDIFAVNPDGSRLRSYVDTPEGFASAYSDWSPDGKTLTFDSDRSGNTEIYLRTRAGKLRQLTHDPAGDSHPTWTPDGRHIAFESDRSGTKQVHVMNRDGSHVRQITHFLPGAEEPAVSPTGKWIAFLSGPVERTALYVVRPNGTGLRKLTPRSMNAGHPSWSPDGRRIVFNTNIEKANGRIWTVGVDRSMRQLTSGPDGLEDFEPTYSPDGRYIAFSRYVDDPATTDIWIMRANGTRAHNLTPASAGFDLAATWAPTR